MHLGKRLHRMEINLRTVNEAVEPLAPRPSLDNCLLQQFEEHITSLKAELEDIAQPALVKYSNSFPICHYLSLNWQIVTKYWMLTDTVRDAQTRHVQFTIHIHVHSRANKIITSYWDNEHSSL